MKNLYKMLFWLVGPIKLIWSKRETERERDGARGRRRKSEREQKGDGARVKGSERETEQE